MCCYYYTITNIHFHPDCQIFANFYGFYVISSLDQEISWQKSFFFYFRNHWKYFLLHYFLFSDIISLFTFSLFYFR